MIVFEHVEFSMTIMNKLLKKERKEKPLHSYIIYFKFIL